ncbi:MAG: ATP synthase F1 subunit gamma [Culturomica sp.]|jgi:F-type H+-transporting ATPase subunit gamma|nr:ATP synthase F1 subunit gamma [Culturomica sp.]
MATMRDLKRRIGSVQSSRKITGAMKMISSARKKRAELALNQARPYEEQLQLLLNHISEADCDYVSPLSEQRKVSRVTLVVLSSNEGLSGAFNSNLYKKMQERVTALAQEGVARPEVYPIGKKIQNYLRRQPAVEKREIPEQFPAGSTAEGVKVLTEELIRRFLAKETDRVELIYTRYKSIGSQETVSLPLLPVRPRSEQLPKEQAGPDTPEKEHTYLYEPGRREILDVLYPLLVRTVFHKAFIENHVSEEAARILSMQIANDNANKLLNRLQLDYNKLRQQSITTELLDITGGSVTE